MRSRVQSVTCPKWIGYIALILMFSSIAATFLFGIPTFPFLVVYLIMNGFLLALISKSIMSKAWSFAIYLTLPGYAYLTRVVMIEFSQDYNNPFNWMLFAAASISVILLSVGLTLILLKVLHRC